VNDLGSLEDLAYLLTHDTVYGKAPFPVAVEGDKLMVNGVPVAFLQVKDPARFPGKISL
jgi:glyceraldehyde 3-phosphate dehydrogenase